MCIMSGIFITHLLKLISAVQIKFAPLGCEGIGLSDGEMMERLWSYVRCFGRMTKEMRPAHRTDILTHALLYYGLRTKAKLCMHSMLGFIFTLI